MEWDDLRLALALARAGGLKAAAARLAVDPSTVYRRLDRLERDLGALLFERSPQGYRATEAGSRVIDAAERMESEAAAIDRGVTGRKSVLAGHLRIAAAAALAEPVLMPQIAAFRRRHPLVTVTLAIEDGFLKLARREVDIAIAAAPPEAGGLYSRKLAELGWAVYGARAYFKEHPAPQRPQHLGDHALIGWETGAAPPALRRWLQALGAEEAVVFRSDSLGVQAAAARTGLGLAILPCCIGDRAPGLTRVLAPVGALTQPIWLATPGELRRLARVRAFFALAGAGIRGARARLGGRAAESAPGRGQTH